MELQEGNMDAAQTGRTMSTGLEKVAERAKRDPDLRFNSLAHLIDGTALTRSFSRLRKDAAVGVDKMTKEAYGQNLEENIEELLKRLKAGSYRHQPILRVQIEKAPGKTRPIGISTVGDKIVQGAIREVLEAIYEQDFLPCSHGFRPGRSAHDALRDIDKMGPERVEWVLEADITAFFDSIDRKKLMEILQLRVIDGALLRLIGKCLHVGVLDGEDLTVPDEGTVQGSGLSPLLGNIYLHHILDLWLTREVFPGLDGTARLVRYADDFVIGFQRREDAERVMDALQRRMADFGLKLHPEKTRLLPFKRPNDGGRGKGPATFDFLGFTIYWLKGGNGEWRLGMKTREARLQRAIKVIGEFCRDHRHQTLREQYDKLRSRITGHFNYFGVNGNTRSLQLLRHKAKGLWLKWLNRRSHKPSYTWERFNDLLKFFPLPLARIRVQIWGASKTIPQKSRMVETS